MQLSQQQQQAFDAIKTFIDSDASIFILRGYAGTGKTTMIKEVVNYAKPRQSIRLMAPTGRAARVLEHRTGCHADTIHRGIYNAIGVELKETDDVAKSEFKMHLSIVSDTEKKLVIIDEASMISSKTSTDEIFEAGTNNLMDDLLTYVRPNSGGKIIFIGDPAQLPPVGDSCSQALNPDFFAKKGMKVMHAELTEILRQKGDSAILRNSMKIRNLLDTSTRNQLVFEERAGEVESLKPDEIIPQYLRMKDHGTIGAIICYTNHDAAQYNKDIRQAIFGSPDSPLHIGEPLMVTQNNYHLNVMNGEWLTVTHIGSTEHTSTRVYVDEGGAKVAKHIEMHFLNVTITDNFGNQHDCKLLLNFLENDRAALTISEHKALFIDFRKRNPELKPHTKEFAKDIFNDPYYNCLKAKYGYAVTGHKCQGGEWSSVIVDYSGRTGFSDECLRWDYTATTRASHTLYIANMPRITPFTKFHIDPITACHKMNEDCRIISHTDTSPYLSADAEPFRHAKALCIAANMADTPFGIDRIVSKPYQEMYFISTPEGIGRFDIRYRKGGLFNKSTTVNPSAYSTEICQLLDDERNMPIEFTYSPSDDIHSHLFSLISAAASSLNIPITNVVERPDYSVDYFFITSGSFSMMKIYVTAKKTVTYARPMSLSGPNDNQLALLINEIKKLCS